MKIKNIFILLIISAIIDFILSKEEKFLSKFKIKKHPQTLKSFLEVESENNDDSYEEINLEKFIKKLHLILPGTFRNRNEDYAIEDESEGKIIKFNPFKETRVHPGSTVVKIEGNKTIKLSGKKNFKNAYIKKVKNYNGVSIRLNEEGDFCNKDGKKHQTTFLIGCDHDVENNNFLDTMKYSSNENSCNHQIEMRFLFGCKLKSGIQLYKFINKYKSSIAIPLIVLGGIINFVGARFFNITVYFICGTSACYITIPLILAFKDELLSTDERILGCILGSFVIGAIIGIWLKNKAKLPIILLSGLAGYSANSLVYSLISKFITNDYLYYICLVGSIGIAIFLGLLFIKYIAIIATAAFGGHLAMKEAGPIYFPDYEDYFTIGWIVISFFGFWFQWKYRDSIGPIFDKK